MTSGLGGKSYAEARGLPDRVDLSRSWIELIARNELLFFFPLFKEKCKNPGCTKLIA